MWYSKIINLRLKFLQLHFTVTLVVLTTIALPPTSKNRRLLGINWIKVVLSSWLMYLQSIDGYKWFETSWRMRKRGRERERERKREREITTNIWGRGALVGHGRSLHLAVFFSSMKLLHSVSSTLISCSSFASHWVQCTFLVFFPRPQVTEHWWCWWWSWVDWFVICVGRRANTWPNEH